MTTVTIKENEISITGHAGDHDTCTRISTLLAAFQVCTENLYHIDFYFHIDTDAHCYIRNLDVLQNHPQGAVLLESLIYALYILASEYPKYVRVMCE